ncbi:MAG: hypothetical protein ACXAC2_00005 [Candidatus Kariarchaeaceae archaeon]|jgi:hypothetical protein
MGLDRDMEATYNAGIAEGITINPAWGDDVNTNLDDKFARSASVGAITVNFTAPDQIVRTAGDFNVDGVQVGDFLLITNAVDSANNGLFEVESVDSATTITTVQTTIVTQAGDAINVVLLQYAEGLAAGEIAGSDVRATNQVLTDFINELTSANGINIDGVILKDNQVQSDTIIEKTADAGVTIEGIKIKDYYTPDFFMYQYKVGAGGYAEARDATDFENSASSPAWSLVNNPTRWEMDSLYTGTYSEGLCAIRTHPTTYFFVHGNINRLLIVQTFKELANNLDSAGVKIKWQRTDHLNNITNPEEILGTLTAGEGPTTYISTPITVAKGDYIYVRAWLPHRNDLGGSGIKLAFYGAILYAYKV